MEIFDKGAKMDQSLSLLMKEQRCKLSFVCFGIKVISLPIVDKMVDAKSKDVQKFHIRASVSLLSDLKHRVL